MLGGTFVCGLHVHHIDAKFSARLPILFAAFLNHVVPFYHHTVDSLWISKNIRYGLSP